MGAYVRSVKEKIGKEVDVYNLTLNDKKTFEMLSKGETMGVFQLGGSGMTRYLKELKPTRVEDLMVMVALYRPGPMSIIPEYIARKNNPKKVKFLDPRMKDYLDKSYGLIVYQDDLLFSAISLAGYTWEEADKFRKAVGKKIPAEMAAQKTKFKEGIVKNGQTEEFAEDLWEIFEPFQAYGFNKAHAASYGMVAYQTAYMKANYPVEFMTALLTAESNDADKISAAVNECRRMGIKVLPPDINESDIGFKIVDYKDSLEGRAIRFGLSAIKNVGNASIDAILSARAEIGFKSFADFLSKVDSRRVNKKVLESLIKVGALSPFGSRAALLFKIDEIRAKVAKPKANENQEGLFDSDIKAAAESVSTEMVMADVSEFTQEELQTLERQLLGFSLSAKPVGEILGPLSHEATHKIFEISPHETFGESVRIAAVVTEVKIVVTRNSGQEMAFVRAEDETGSIELVVFPKIFKFTRNLWVDYKPLLISGRIDSREEAPTLIVEAIDSGEVKQGEQNEVFIRVPKEVSSGKLRRLKGILDVNPGAAAVTLVFEGRRERVRLPAKISWSEDLALKISQILEAQEAS